MNTNHSQFAYELRTVVRLTGFSKLVLHAWERRYGVVRPRRGPDGARLYSDEEVHHLQLLRKCIDGGHRIGKLASLDVSELKRVAGECSPDIMIPVDDIVASVRSDDTASIESRLSLHFAALGPARFAKLIVVPLMSEIGALWEHGQASVASEHYVSSILRTLLGQGLRLTEPSDAEVLVMFATPENELHELGALMVGILAQSAGFRAIYLGPQLPAETVSRACASLGAHIVCLSSTALPKAEVKRLVSNIISDLPPETELWLGGQAFTALRDELNPRASVFQDIPDFLDAIERFRVRVTQT